MICCRETPVVSPLWTYATASGESRSRLRSEREGLGHRVVPVELTALERAVIDVLLSRQEPGYDELRMQFQTCRAASREMTGVGFYTALEVDADTATAPADVGNPLGDGRGFPDDVHAEIDGLKHGAGFVLWLDAGRLECLEGFAYAEPWPNEVLAFEAKLTPIRR